MDAHMFIDNSNLIGGARRTAKVHEPAVPWPAVRIEYANFFALIESGFDVKTRVFAGSVPPGNGDLWKHAKKARYETDLLRKVERDDGMLEEQGVDELLHLKIANVLLDNQAPQTLVIVTGDGARSDFGTSFTEYVRRASRLGWDTVVWSWSRNLSPRYKEMIRDGVRLKVHSLDAHYDRVTFIKGGNWILDGSLVVPTETRRASASA
jgi:hypothetical protein